MPIKYKPKRQLPGKDYAGFEKEMLVKWHEEPILCMPLPSHFTA
jgi:hypothetical protein